MNRLSTLFALGVALGGCHAQACPSLPSVAGTAPPASVAARSAPPHTFDDPPAYFEVLSARARAAATEPYEPGATLDPDGALAQLTYDQHRRIRFRPSASVFHGEPGLFEAQLFHLGATARTPVAISVVRGDVTDPVHYTGAAFQYDDGELPAALSATAYAGFRMHGPINTEDYRDEVIVFQGASYFRSLGPGQTYGLSARGLAIDTGTPGPEEFPVFDAFYLLPPRAGERSVWVLATLDSPHATGAYAFHVTLGPETVVDVTAHVFLRGSVEVLGLAPLTSMFLFGEEAPARGGDFRPEVHDSDVLVSVSGAGEQLARPLRNPSSTTVSTLRLDSPRGFGLLQRDRSFASYQDLEAHYQSRPSVWIEPQGDWGPGAIRLLEIATTLETDDNIAALWVPDAVPAEGLQVRYRMRFGDTVEPLAGARAIATRVASLAPGRSRFLVDFAGPLLAGATDLRLEVTPGDATLVEAHLEPNPHTGGVRASFEVQSIRTEVVLRAFLASGDSALSETWSYLWQPTR